MMSAIESSPKMLSPVLAKEEVGIDLLIYF
jgi:hypothetical protein